MPLDIDSRGLYTLLVVLVAAGRLVELRIAEHNRRQLLARGAVEASPGHYPWMVLLHTAFLIACPLEVWLLGRPFLPGLAAVALVVLVLAMALRGWVISALGGRGGRWTTRILCLPGVAPVTGGPYRYLRHPNYLAVIAEIAALPLVHTAWLTAAVFSLLNAWLLRVRIAAEEAALTELSGYGPAFADRPRLVPGGGGGR
ncbi:MAG TPA: isoprenylcysteine carboxylmethyltransferase family protein [Thermoanaerobaculia bacterium]|nr:isoprenylcysteine carboxylmethyltransferase family protein [Thermoanaerobaculia bacterium]